MSSLVVFDALHSFSIFFFFNDTATTEIYTLSLHDALPISFLFGSEVKALLVHPAMHAAMDCEGLLEYMTFQNFFTDRTLFAGDRKSTRLNSSHGYISYAVFCLKKKKNRQFHANSTTSTIEA